MQLCFVAVLLAGMGCESRRAAPPDTPRLPRDYTLLVHSADVGLLLESQSERLVVRSTGAPVECDVSPKIAQSWQRVQQLSSGGRPYRRHMLALNPNVEAADVVIGVAKRLGEEEFEIRHIEDGESIKSAAEALNTILTECGVEETLSPTVILTRRE